VIFTIQLRLGGGISNLRGFGEDRIQMLDLWLPVGKGVWVSWGFCCLVSEDKIETYVRDSRFAGIVPN